ncbi:MAG: hypothetical protein J6S67_23345 [Methanobrevibacter sp.]|nr:hypothetical protein [Methanobrevibacter sp.]
MKTQEELLNLRNKIAGTLGTKEVQDVLQEFLTSARAELTSWIITANDPHAYNMHRMLGRVEMVEYLINQGKAAIKAKETKGKK